VKSLKLIYQLQLKKYIDGEQLPKYTMNLIMSLVLKFLDGKGVKPELSVPVNPAAAAAAAATGEDTGATGDPGVFYLTETPAKGIGKKSSRVENLIEKGQFVSETEELIDMAEFDDDVADALEQDEADHERSNELFETTKKNLMIVNDNDMGADLRTKAFMQPILTPVQKKISISMLKGLTLDQYEILHKELFSYLQQVPAAKASTTGKGFRDR
jgi:hypothetical protein